MKVKKNWAISPETDFEIRRLAKLWGVSINRTLERCAHYVATMKVTQAPVIEKVAALRQAEAKVEMLKGQDRG